jgi:exonuclease SbcD
LHTADWHLGKTLEGRSRLPEQEAFLDELNQIVKEEQIDAVIMAGDAFDTVNPPSSAEKLFYESLSVLADKGRRPVVVIAGNHDHPDRLQAASPLTDGQPIYLVGYPTTETFDIPIKPSGELLTVSPLAYPSEARLNEVLADDFDEVLLRDHYNEKIKQAYDQISKSFKRDAVNIAISHLYVAGGSQSDSERPIEVGGAYTVAAESLPKSADYVALGHLHRPQTIKRSSVPARYSGSPLAYSFSEAGYTKSVSVIDIKAGEKADVKEIFLSSGKPLVKWQAKEGLNQVYSWIGEGKDKNAWVDLEVHAEDQLSIEEIHRLRKLHPGFIHIRPIYKESRAAQNSVHTKQLTIDEMFIKFYERQTGGALPDEEMIKLFLELSSGQEADSE